MHCHSNLFVVHCLSFLTQRIDSIYSSNNACANCFASKGCQRALVTTRNVFPKMEFGWEGAVFACAGADECAGVAANNASPTSLGRTGCEFFGSGATESPGQVG